MKHSIRAAVLSGLALVLVSGIALAADGTWVAADGNVHQLRHGKAMFFSEDGAERFDLSELRDGETRTFGSGARAVTVSRSGDSVTISRTESGDDVSVIDVTCDVNQDSCTVLTFPDDPEKVMIAIEKERVCVNGEGDCDFSGGIAAAGHIVVDIDCEGEDCPELHGLQELQLGEFHQKLIVEALGSEDGEPSRIVIRRIGEGPGNDDNVFVTRSGSICETIHTAHGDQVVLRCAEGDATITVDREEAGDTFLCPKHSTPMERVNSGVNAPVHVIRRGISREH